MSDFWSEVRASTPARIGLGRAGNGVPTAEVLAFGAAHAAARDAIHLPLDVETLVMGLDGLGLGETATVPSAAPDRATYLTRPDLGRTPAAGALDALVRTRISEGQNPDVAVVVADGLSAEAVDRHAVNLLAELLPLLGNAISVAAPVVATQARVALGDPIGQAMGAQLVLVLIGERPGLSSSDSLGAYLTWQPRPGIQDSARNCVSNIRPPHGLDYGTAARTIASLVVGARELGATGIGLKEGFTLPTPS
ncbi:ethanolamine ammonia-lyase subunit EutC [Nocardioides sp. Kera G14]|uniref:ethanolamine ammonia-lyase subunit EutC n=1 Tax=Nocardioides sp. Kera G14 TaxID=2884264 RepID=UPI001D123EF1|nr:ethanolamine ammonia-lyase subunit EutC [Nocardioides sp. Kera G14]UDY25145.1 ethanolamine ammonia-lyase subunit EutC [Nocardioides sp. Kera G14]